MGSERVAGYMELSINGIQYNAVGNFTFNLGRPKREPMLGPDKMHGFKETVQAAKVSGEIRDGSAINATEEILKMDDATIVLKVASGKKYMFEQAFYSGDGNMETEDGKIMFEASSELQGTEVA